MMTNASFSDAQIYHSFVNSSVGLTPGDAVPRLDLGYDCLLMRANALSAVIPEMASNQLFCIYPVF